MSFILLGILNSQAAGGAAAAQYLSVVYTAGRQWYQDASVNDSQNNVYTGGKIFRSSGNPKAGIAKLDSTGTKVLGYDYSAGADSMDTCWANTVDSSDNLYISGSAADMGGIRAGYLAKLDSDLNVSWVRRQSYTSINSNNRTSLGPSGSILVGGSAAVTGAYAAAIITKYDTSGNLNFSAWRAGNSTDLGAAFITAKEDSSGNMYGIGYRNPSNNLYVVKWNSSGTEQWQYSYSGGMEVGYDCEIDSSGNLYIVGYGGGNFYVIKLDSSGTIQWQYYYRASLNTTGLGIHLGADGYLYVVGEEPGPTTSGLVIKMDTSGTIQWQRKIYVLAELLNIRNIKTSADGSTLYIGGRTMNTGGWAGNPYYNHFLANLPADGSKTATYSLGGTNVVYAASSLTRYTGSMTRTTRSYSQSGSNGFGSSSLTRYSQSATQELTTI